MASASSTTFKNFRMPSEPHPLPSLSSDEESFVILGKSLSPETDEPSSEEIFEPSSVSIIQEAKTLLTNEISMLEQMSLKIGNVNESHTSNSLGNNIQSHDQSDLSREKQSKGGAVIQNDQSVAFSSSSDIEQSAILDLSKPLLMGLPDLRNFPKLSFDDLPSEEVQGKISQIIDENMHLKDTLLQNNMSMKSQYERIVAWQEDVQKVHQAHRLKLVEAKEFIEKLKAESLMVKHQLEKSNGVIEKQMNEIVHLNMMLDESKRLTHEKIVQSSEKNIKEFELDSANKKNKELEASLKSLEAENTILKDDKLKLETTLNARINQNAKLMQENTFLHNENLRLTDSSNIKTNETVQIKQKYIQLEVELEKTKKNAEEREAHHSKLLSDLQQSACNFTELANLRSELANMQGMLMQTEQSRAAAYAQVAMMANQIGELTNNIESLKAQSHHKDEIYALQTQIEVFKTDFEAEKHSKEVIKEEKEKLAEDLQNLQRRNQQLQEEIEITRENCDFVVYPTNNRPAPVTTPNVNLKRCPKCSFGFTTINALENHVYRCLELDDNLP